MNTTIYIIRHGQTQGNKSRVFQGQIDTPLNDDGRAQILEACKDMVKLGITFDQIICSPLSRAIESAQIIHSFFPTRKEIIIDDRAIERSFGDAEGLPLTPQNYNKIMRAEFPNQETEEHIIWRAQSLIKDILNKYEGKNILIVSHSHFLKACLIPYLPGLKFDSKTVNAGISMLKFNDFKHCIKVELLLNNKDQ